MTAENPSELDRMRISDAERDRAASVLAGALAEGRLTAEEHAERLDAIYVSKTQAELVRLVSDLPGATAALRAPGGTLMPHDAAGLPEPASRKARMIAVFSATSRRGMWRVPARSRRSACSATATSTCATRFCLARRFGSGR